MNDVIEKIACWLVRAYDWLIRLPQDKLLHVVVSVVLTSLFGLILPFLALLIVMTLIYLCWEIYEKANSNKRIEISDVITYYVGFLIGLI